eukprot:2350996-Pleurochrysis_carterae.AAC.8
MLGRCLAAALVGEGSTQRAGRQGVRKAGVPSVQGDQGPYGKGELKIGPSSSEDTYRKLDSVRKVDSWGRSIESGQAERNAEIRRGRVPASYSGALEPRRRRG